MALPTPKEIYEERLKNIDRIAAQDRMTKGFYDSLKHVAGMEYNLLEARLAREKGQRDLVQAHVVEALEAYRLAREGLLNEAMEGSSPSQNTALAELCTAAINKEAEEQGYVINGREQREDFFGLGEDMEKIFEVLRERGI